jgi:hypothetical protein
MSTGDQWLEIYGPIDGRWLRGELAHMTEGLHDIRDVRLARLGDAQEMQQYAALADTGEGVSGDWELISPHTGARYMMGCNWRD